jgi:hypothetical protein
MSEREEVKQAKELHEAAIRQVTVHAIGDFDLRAEAPERCGRHGTHHCHRQ